MENGNSDTIQIVPYSPQWREAANLEIAVLKRTLAGINTEFEHIGSTAIPELSAKPIIDLMVGVSSIEEAKRTISPLETLGYSYWSDNPSL